MSLKVSINWFTFFSKFATWFTYYVAYSADASKFESILIDLLEKPDAPFHFLLQEIKTILLDSVVDNFQKIHYWGKIEKRHTVPGVFNKGHSLVE